MSCQSNYIHPKRSMVPKSNYFLTSKHEQSNLGRAFTNNDVFYCIGLINRQYYWSATRVYNSLLIPVAELYNSAEGHQVNHRA